MTAREPGEAYVVEGDVRRFLVLSEVSRIALEPGTLAEILGRISEYVQERFALALVSIVVADESGTEWEFRGFAPRAVGERRSRRRWPVSAGVVGRAIRSGEAQLVLDVRQDPDYFGVLEEVVAELVVPIQFQDRVLGAINYEAADPGVFSSDNLALFLALAGQLAGAIELTLANRRLQEANHALERLTRIDSLTGVANRRHFDETLEVEWRRALRAEEPVALVLADIDCFKPFNDAYGHQRGDESLRRVAEVLGTGLQRVADLAARYGGEEFALLLPGLDEGEAAGLAERLRRQVEALAIPHGRSTVARHVTLSAGVAAAVPVREEDPALLVGAADGALYRAKQAGRNRVVRASEAGAADPGC
ncbi:MAG TPA: sensor domain-containing diguanylate cyclase [Thermoanaerobaculia bacterium]|nr:sensor domain-containing diguanylate cyclase [Thermoanaerobaculia bacterium]